MNEKRYSDPPVAAGDTRQGANDGRWYLIEHSLYQAQMSINQAHQACRHIARNSENDDEKVVADAVLMYLCRLQYDCNEDLLAVGAIMTDTAVSDKIGGYER